MTNYKYYVGLSWTFENLVKVICKDFISNIEPDLKSVENLACFQASLCNVFTGHSKCITCFFLFTRQSQCGKIHVTVEFRKE